MSTTLPHDYEPHQEEDRVSTRPLVVTYVASVVIGAIAVFFGGVIVAARNGSIRPNWVGPRGEQPSRPEISHIEQTPIWDTQRGLTLEQQHRAWLDEWGWVDRQTGIAIIPIDVAIDVVVQREQSGRQGATPP